MRRSLVVAESRFNSQWIMWNSRGKGISVEPANKKVATVDFGPPQMRSPPFQLPIEFLVVRSGQGMASWVR